MAPSTQQEPIETHTPTSVEQAVVTMRLVKGIEAKIQAESPLDTQEITYLFETEKPLYSRTRDDWPWGMYGDEDPELADRLDRYAGYKRATLESSITTLSEQYGEDAAWFLGSYGEVKNRIPELLAAGANAALLAENLHPSDVLRHFDLLRASGAALHPGDVYSAYKTDSRNNFVPEDITALFIRTYAAELVEIEGVSRDIVYAHLRVIDTIEVPVATKRLIALGIERTEISWCLSKDAVETCFDALLEQGFAPEVLYGRCSKAFVLEHFDTFYDADPELVGRMYRSNIEAAELTSLIIALHKKSQPIDEQLAHMNKGQHYSNTPQYEQLVAAGVAVGDIIDSFPNDGETLIFLYAKWLMEHGADGNAIKAKMSPYAIVVKRQALRDAGIDVNTQHYLDQLPASTLILMQVELKDEPGVAIDYAALLDTFEGELTLDYAARFIEAGADPKQVFARLAAGSIVNDYFYEHFIEAGVPATDVLSKANDPYRRAFYWQSLNDESTNDDAFSEALKVLPFDMVVDAIETIVKRPQHMHALIDRLSEKGGVDHRMEFLFTHGADINYILQHVSKGSYKLYNDAEWLLDNGADGHVLFALLAPKLTGFSSPEKFISAGVPAEDVFEAVGTWYVERHFDELGQKYDKKMLVGRVMQKPSSGFILKNLQELCALGWSADELSGHLESREIFGAIEGFMLAGLSPAIAITHVMQLHRGRSQADCEEILTSRLGVAL